MQNEYEIKKEMCEIGKRVYDRGMVASNDGNFSVKLNDNEFLCTPTGGNPADPADYAGSGHCIGLRSHC